MGVFRHMWGRRVALWTLVAVLALSGAMGVVTADSHGSVERDGDSITVTVPASSFDGNQSAVVRVNGEVETRYTPTFSGGENTTTLSLQRFREQPGSLAAANVTVTVDNETLANETLNLQYIEPAGDAALTVRDDGSYVVLPVEESTEVGIEPNEEVDIDVTNDGDTETVTGRYTGGGELLVPMASIRDAVGVSGNLTLEPLPTVSDVSYEITPTNATAGIYPTENATVLTHPLVFSDTSYDVEVTTADPEGTYSQRVTPTTDGQFRLPASIFYAESVSVSISEVDGDFTYDSSGPLSTSSSVETVNGTWFADNETLTVDGAFPADVSAVWIRDNGTVSTVSADRVNASTRTVNLSGTGVVPSNNSTALLVGAQTLSVDISVQPTNTTTQEPSDQSMLKSIITALTNNIPIIATLLLTPVVGLITFKTTQGINGINADSVTAGVVAVVLGIGLAVSRLSDGPLVAAAFLLFALVVAGIQILVWLELAKKQGFDKLVSVGVGILAAALVVGVVAGVKLLALDPDSEMSSYLSLAGAVYGLVASGVWTGVMSVGAAASGSGSTGPPTYDTKLRIEDETGSLITDQMQITLTHGEGLEGSQTATITGGSTTVSLEQGKWTAEATMHGQTVRARTTVHRAGHRLTLQFSGRSVRLSVVDKETREKIPDAKLLVTVDGEQQRHTPDQNGRWEETYPRSADDLSVTVTHDRYEDVSISRSLADDINGTVQMTPLKGTLVASVTVDGRGVPDIPVELTPTETALSEGFSGTTNANGEVTFDGVRIGAYDAVPSLADKPTEFTADSVSVRISEGKRTRESLPIRFDYELSGDHRRTIRDLRDRASDIATVSRRDGAIQSFYASVVHELLDTVEAIPSRPQPLLVVGIAPDRLVSAMLSAVEKATDTVDEVMSSKRNVDLFAACTDLPSASVTWEGEASIERLLELSEQEIGQQRGELANRVEQTDDRITRERSELAEVSPAQEMLEAVRTMVRDSANVSQVDSAALVVAAEALLDAIESLFTRTQLRERMERTVY